MTLPGKHASALSVSKRYLESKTILRGLVWLLAALFAQDTLAEATRAPFEKFLCCQGREYGVFDLSGTWQGVSLHNPPFGTFTQPGMLYQDTGTSGRAIWSVNLDQQTVGEVQVNGGQEVLQTYSGTYIETWYESPNFTGECTVFPTANCRVVNRFASYDLVMTVRWCKAAEGFYFHSMAATDITLVASDSGIDIPSRLANLFSPGEVCPSVTPTLSLMTYDAQDNLMISGFDPAVGGTFSAYQEPSLFDIREFRPGEREECACEGMGTNRPVHGIAKKIGPAGVAALTGDISFMVSSTLPLDLVDPPFRPMGDMSLLQQKVAVRERLPEETDIEWHSYLQTLKDDFSFIDIVPTYDSGTYRFHDVPLFDVVTVNGRPLVRPARYRLRLRGINAEEFIAGTEPPETRFTSFTTADAFNLQAGESTALSVTPIDEYPLKRALIDELSEISPSRYLPIENLALAQVVSLEGGAPTAAQLEGLRRAVLSERVVRDGARFGEQHVTQVLTGLGEILGFFIDEILDSYGTGKHLKDKQDELARIESGVDLPALGGDGWSDLPASDTATREAMEKFVKDNFDLQISEIAKRLKVWLKVALLELKNVQELAGMQTADSDLVFTVLEVTLSTVLDTVIEQGVGAIGSAAKAALKAALLTAQDDLFDTLPHSYTDQTDEVLAWGETQFESWGTASPVNFALNKGWVEDELLQMGIDSHSSLSTAQALSDVSAGFDTAEDTLAIGESIPIIKKAKWVAKMGKYILGIAAGLGTVLTDRLETTLLALETEVSGLITAWQANALDDLVDTVGGEGPSDYSPLIKQALADIGDLQAMAASNTELFGNGRQMMSAFGSAALAFEEAAQIASGQQMDVLVRLFARDYSGPLDPAYLNERSTVLAGLNRVLVNSQTLRTGIGLLSDGVQFSVFDSPVVVSEVAAVSQSTAGTEVTQTNEVFTLTARIRNLGRLAVSGIEAELSVPAGMPITIDVAAIQVPGDGALDPNDGSPGTGPDEETVSWQITYTGPIDDQVRIPLRIETRSTTVDDPGNHFGTYGQLFVDAAVFDPDGDGMPTAWEDDHGLNPAVDDGEDDDDLDGLSNADEFEYETDPQVADSDSDGLDDGDEVNGATGWITDPADDDSDDDGEPDGTDGSPLDPTSTAAAAAPEPVVSVSPQQVLLDAETPFVQVTVSNAGSGVLLWTARSDDESRVVVGNPDGTVQTGSRLLIGAPPGLDPDQHIGESVLVEVRDVSGTIRDTQSITVTFGDASEFVFEDGFED